jgi:hypothetical protein
VEYGDVGEEVAELREEIANLKTELAEEKADATALDADNKELRAKMEAGGWCAKDNGERDYCECSKCELETEVKELRAKVTVAEQTVTSATARLTDSEDLLAKMRESHVHRIFVKQEQKRAEKAEKRLKNLEEDQERAWKWVDLLRKKYAAELDDEEFDAMMEEMAA